MTNGCYALVVAVLATLPSLSNQLPGVIRIGAILTGELFVIAKTGNRRTGNLGNTDLIEMQDASKNRRADGQGFLQRCEDASKN